MKYNNKNTKDAQTIIGKNTVIREQVTINFPIKDLTKIGENCYLMAKTHVGHDAILENNVILSTSSIVGGHSIMHEGSRLGLNSCTHQRTVVGAYTIVGMNTPLKKNALPFIVVYGNPPRWSKMNSVGINRSNIPDDEKKIIPIILSYQIENVKMGQEVYEKLIQHNEIAKNSPTIMKYFYNFLRDIDMDGIARFNGVLEEREDSKWNVIK